MKLKLSDREVKIVYQALGDYCSKIHCMAIEEDAARRNGKRNMCAFVNRELEQEAQAIRDRIANYC